MDDVALFGRQGIHGGAGGGEHELVLGQAGAVDGEEVGIVGDVAGFAPGGAAARIVDEGVAQDAKDPRPERHGGVAGDAGGEGAFGRGLDEIVGEVGAPAERECIAAQRRLERDQILRTMDRSAAIDGSFGLHSCVRRNKVLAANKDDAPRCARVKFTTAGALRAGTAGLCTQTVPDVPVADLPDAPAVAVTAVPTVAFVPPAGTLAGGERVVVAGDANVGAAAESPLPVEPAPD